MIRNLRSMLAMVLVGLLSLSFFSSIATAQEEPRTQRERELEDMVRRLSQRVDELERKQVEGENTAGLETAINNVTSELNLADNGYTVFHKGNTIFDGEGGKFKFAIFGRIQNDWTFATQDEDLESTAIGHLEDGTRFRRARLGVSGEYYKVNFKLEFDFAQGDADFTDAYMGIDFQDEFRVRVGQFREPFGFEQLSSSRFIHFIERGLPDTFSPARNTGLMFFGTFADKNINYAIGFFRDTDNFGDNRDLPGTSGFEYEDGSYAVTGRLTGTPIYQDNGETVWHIGAAFSYRNPNQDTFRIRQRPEARIITNFVDTGNLAADDVLLAAFETALILGSFSAQAEFVYNAVDGGSGSTEDEDFYGWYVQAGFFLTGEHRVFKQDGATLDRIKPKANLLNGEGGAGAWELVARVSGIDLTDGDATGGELIDLTFGVNWFLNPNTRISFNYTYADLCDRFSNGDDGEGHIFTMRFQIDF